MVLKFIIMQQGSKRHFEEVQLITVSVFVCKYLDKQSPRLLMKIILDWETGFLALEKRRICSYANLAIKYSTYTSYFIVRVVYS